MTFAYAGQETLGAVGTAGGAGAAGAASADRRPVYLDYAAATPMDPEVVDAMLPYFTDAFENPSAPYAAARAVRADVEDARAACAHVIGARPGNVTFTAGATEANNLAFAAAGPDAHVGVDAVEHESVLAVSHGSAIKEFMDHVKGAAADERDRVPGNCSVLHFVFDDEAGTFELVEIFTQEDYARELGLEPLVATAGPQRG